MLFETHQPLESDGASRLCLLFPAWQGGAAVPRAGHRPPRLGCGGEQPSPRRPRAASPCVSMSHPGCTPAIYREVPHVRRGSFVVSNRGAKEVLESGNEMKGSFGSVRFLSGQRSSLADGFPALLPRSASASALFRGLKNEETGTEDPQGASSLCRPAQPLESGGIQGSHVCSANDLSLLPGVSPAHC